MAGWSAPWGTVLLPSVVNGGRWYNADAGEAQKFQARYNSGDWNANRMDAGSMLSQFSATAATSGTSSALNQLFQQVSANTQPTNWGGINGTIEGNPLNSFGREFGRDIFAYDANISAEALFKANATPAMLDIYNQLPPDQQRAMQVQAVLNHLEVVNQIATNFIKWNKETLMAIARNIA